MKAEKGNQQLRSEPQRGDLADLHTISFSHEFQGGEDMRACCANCRYGKIKDPHYIWIGIYVYCRLYRLHKGQWFFRLDDRCGWHRRKSEDITQ